MASVLREDRWNNALTPRSVTLVPVKSSERYVNDAVTERKLQRSGSVSAMLERSKSFRDVQLIRPGKSATEGKVH